MIPGEVEEALASLKAAVLAQPEIEAALRAKWRGGGGDPSRDGRAAADRVNDALPALTKTHAPELATLFDKPAGEMLLTWCAASTWRRDAELAPLLACAKADVKAIAR